MFLISFRIRRRSARPLTGVNVIMRLRAYAHAMSSHLSLVNLLAALSEPTRLSALGIIWDGDEHCVCELMARLGVSQSRMSRHMARLKAIGLLTDRRDAQWVRYRRNPDVPAAWVAIIDTVLAAAAADMRPPFQTKVA